MTSPLPLLAVNDDLRFLVLECESQGASEAAARWLDAGLVVRRVRGRKERTWKGLFDEFSAALQFPAYFGENADAFDECIADLAWLPPRNGYVIVVGEPGQVLINAGAGALSALVSSLQRAAQEWARPVDLGEWWDRPAVPFHVVLQAAIGDAATVTRRWTEAGALVLPFFS